MILPAPAGVVGGAVGVGGVESGKSGGNGGAAVVGGEQTGLGLAVPLGAGLGAAALALLGCGYCVMYEVRNARGRGGGGRGDESSEDDEEDEEEGGEQEGPTGVGEGAPENEGAREQLQGGEEAREATRVGPAAMIRGKTLEFVMLPPLPETPILRGSRAPARHAAKLGGVQAPLEGDAGGGGGERKGSGGGDEVGAAPRLEATPPGGELAVLPGSEAAGPLRGTVVVSELQSVTSPISRTASRLRGVLETEPELFSILAEAGLQRSETASPTQAGEYGWRAGGGGGEEDEGEELAGPAPQLGGLAALWRVALSTRPPQAKVNGAGKGAKTMKEAGGAGSLGECIEGEGGGGGEGRVV